MLSISERYSTTHAKALPFGSAAGTYIVAKFIRGGEWLFWHSWDAMIDSASLGAVGYAFCIATVEGIIVIGIMTADYVRKQRNKVIAERDAEWRSWLKRRDAAVAAGENFSEPMPGGQTSAPSETSQV